MDNEGEEDCIMMMWPVTIIHPIDEERLVIFRKYNGPGLEGPNAITNIICFKKKFLYVVQGVLS